MTPDLSVVIVTWNTEALTTACLRSLRADPSDRFTREIIVVDNASNDDTVANIEAEFPSVVLLRNPANYLYSRANNQGVAAARGRYVCLLNSDTEVTPGALERMLEFLERSPDYGGVSPQLLNFDGTVQPACCRFPGLLDPLVDGTALRHLGFARRLAEHTRMADFDHCNSRDVEQPPLACMLLRREDYLRIGGLDEALSLFFNDVDLCLRIHQQGHKLRFLADAVVYHRKGASVHRYNVRNSNVLWVRNRRTFYEKYYRLKGRLWLDALYVAWVSEVAAGIMLGPRNRGRIGQSLTELWNHARAVFAD